MSWYHAEVLVASHKFDDAMKVYMDVRGQAGTDDQRTSVFKNTELININETCYLSQIFQVHHDWCYICYDYHDFIVNLNQRSHYNIRCVYSFVEQLLYLLFPFQWPY